MNLLPTDIRYAYAKLGVAGTVTPEDIREIITNARTYRFATRERIAEIERFVMFLSARNKLGTAQDSFDVIRKSYHHKAMALHPDRNRDNPQAEEELKSVNAGYEIIEAVHREARDYFKKSDEERDALENEARAATAREAEAAGKKASPRTVHMSYGDAEAETHATPKPEPPRKPRPTGATSYMAGWVPRYIRNSRLFYLGRDAVIASKLMKSEGSVGLLYDVIMLPEREFIRAKLNLGIEGSGSPALEMSRLTPAYTPLDMKKITIPPGETNPHEYARIYFLQEYGFDS